MSARAKNQEVSSEHFSEARSAPLARRIAKRLRVIIGVGIDVVPIERFELASQRTAELLDRLFTADEQRTPSGALRSAESLAARFAAKEAASKALGAPSGMAWHDAEIVVDDRGRPGLKVRGTVAAQAAVLGVTSWHLSLSHDGGIASAVVIAEG